MFSTKRLTALAYATFLACSFAHAQSRPATPRAQATSARVPAANLDMGDEDGANPASAPAAASSQPTAVAPAAAASAPAESHLSIDDADRITRSQLLRQLVGGPGLPTPTVGVNPSAQIVAAPTPAVPVAIHKIVPERTRAEPVRFLGAFSDMTGQSVLYEYRNASYPAHAGTKLLNGWTVKRVDGFVVTVTDGAGKGARTWTETIVGGTPADDQQQPLVNSGIRRLMDLGAPLPPGTPISAIAQ